MMLETLLGDGFRFLEGKILVSLHALMPERKDEEHATDKYWVSSCLNVSWGPPVTQPSRAIGADAPVIACWVSPLQDTLGAR